MTNLYDIGVNRLIYKAANFATGLTVTGYIWNPSLTKSALQTFIEVSDGLYYLDYSFAVVGAHFGKFYEGGVGSTSGVFRVSPIGIAKNVALPYFNFLMVLASDHVTPATGKTIVGEIKQDNGAFVALTNAITEASDGMYEIVSGFTAAEMNADGVTLKFTETDCDQRIIVLYPT